MTVSYSWSPNTITRSRVCAEEMHSDQAYKEWGRKPFTALVRGPGAARAVEDLTPHRDCLRMVSTAASVHIGGADFMSTSPMGAKQGPSKTIGGRPACRHEVGPLDELVLVGPPRRWRRRPAESFHSDATRIGPRSIGVAGLAGRGSSGLRRVCGAFWDA